MNDKGGQNIQWENFSIFNKWFSNWTATCKRIKPDYSLTQCTKINSKWIKDFHVRPEIIKFLEENRGSSLFNISLNSIFLDISPQVTETKAKCDCIKLKSFCIEKKTINKMKKLYMEWERIFTNDIVLWIFKRKAMPQNAQTTTQLHSPHTLVK